MSKFDIKQLQDPYNQTLLSQYHHDSQITDKFGRLLIWIATKKGHRAVLKFLSEECGLISLEQVVLPNRDDVVYVECNVCTSLVSVADPHNYH
ncbi:hypothetical protein PSV08DRAFT_357183 [Bipolaris maydis]|nr:hypothetical protein J3E73DRAFT_368627 [Bipolaris maydis]KAJ6265530.1 hypothetical protein PSV08DRAFT_357183 [Bipolaris maydis]